MLLTFICLWDIWRWILDNDIS